jgi:hypothetical protein
MKKEARWSRVNTQGNRYESAVPRCNIISVTIGKPIEPHNMQDPVEPDSWKTAIKMRDASSEHLLQHCGEPDLTAN